MENMNDMRVPEGTVQKVQRKGRMPYMRMISRSRLAIGVLVLLVIIGGAFYLGRYSVYRVHPDLTNQDQAQELLGRVGKLIKLPTDETPTMATIADAAAVKATQPFLKDTADGDVLIVYTKAQMALVYRPSTNQIITVGPITNSPQAATSASAQASAPDTSTSASDTNTESHDKATSTSAK